MGKFFSKVLGAFLMQLAINLSLFSQYCIPTSTFGPLYDTYINGVVLGTINNTGTGSPTGPTYNDYTSMSALLSRTSQNNLVITGSPYFTNMYYYAWIDYNQDGDLSDANELLGFLKTTVPNQTFSILFNVPAGATPGITRLRVSCAYNVTGLNPCSSYTYGETEDYSVQIPRFIEKSSILTNASYASAVWTDVNNDGFLDALFVSGITGLVHVYQNNSGTSFSDVNTGLEGPKKGVISPGDYNRDGNTDILVSGTKEESIYPATFFTKIYKNNGGTFTDIGAGLPGLYQSSADWGDFDNDGDLDIILSGMGAADPITRIYENKGSDVFSEYPAILKGSSEGDCMWWDYNNDGFLDIIVSGLNIDGNSEIAIYKNMNGNGFSKIAYDFLNIPGQFDLGDYDQDGDVDIVIAGEENMQPSVGGQPKTVVYRNDGNDIFTNINAAIQNVREADVRFGDADNDGDLDILLLGRHLLYANKYIQLYKNMGNDSFELENMSMTPLYGGDLDWGDYDNDSDLDFLYTGNDKYLRIIENYTAAASANTPPSAPTVLSSKMVGNGIQLTFNAGSDNKSLTNGLTYNLRVGTTAGGINIVSPGSDGTTGRMRYSGMGNLNQNKTILISGLSVGTYHWSVQTIDQSYAGSAFSTPQTVTVSDPFTEISPGFPQVSFGKSEWADLNSDGKPDLVITGTATPSPPYSPSTSIWFKGTGDIFTAYSGNNTLEGVWYSSIAPYDYDGDNDIDLYIYGRNSSGLSVSRLYRNTGGTFTSVSHPFGIGGQAAFGDVDNDGDIDVLINNTLYKNTGAGTYTSNSFGSPGLHILFDYDNDGDLDAYKYNLGQIFENDGNGSFILALSTLDELDQAAADVGDYDNDGDLDILVSGFKNYSRLSYIYRNDGNGTFSNIQANIRAIELGRILWIDYDNDGDLDVSMSGASSTSITRIFLNQGNDQFEPITVNLPEYYDSDINWADYDNDNDMDLIYNGRITTPMVTNIYRNNNNYPNPKPATPGNLKSDVKGQSVTLMWDRAFNPADTIESMSYNVRIGSSPGSCDIVSPMSDLSSGKPYLHRLGNAQMAKFKIVNNVDVDTYYWSVQAIDKNSNYSSWAAEQSFDINVLQADFTATSACLGMPTALTDESFTSGVTIDSWHYDFGDGTTSNSENPYHTYANDGTYNVTLTIGSGIYSDAVTKQVYVYKKPVAGFNADIACQGTETSFTNTTNLNGLTVSSWYWDFGNGKASTQETPVNPGLLIAGDYNVTLRITTSEHGCIDEISKTVTVASYPDAAVSADGPVNFCQGESVTLSVSLNAAYIYTWKRDGAAITGANANTYTATISGNYSVVVVNPVGNCSTTSSSVSVVVNIAPVSPLISSAGPLAFCQGESVDLSVSYTDGYNYQWRLNGGAVGANSNRYTATAAGTYSLVVTNATNCIAYSTNTVAVTVNPKPSVPTVNISGTTSFCQGGSVELSVTNTPGYTYQWENNGAGIPDATNVAYAAQNSGIYSLRVTNSFNCSIKTENVNVSVLAIPSAPFISASEPQTICQGDSVLLSVANTSGYVYKWKLNGGDIESVSNQYTAKNNGTYTLVVSNSNGCSVSASNSIAVTVNPVPIVGAISLNGETKFCSGRSVTLSIPEAAGYSYVWKNGSATITGATSSSYLAVSSGDYALEVYAASGCKVVTGPIKVEVAEIPSRPVIDYGEYLKGDCLGENPLKLSVDEVIVGYNYKWYRNDSKLSSSTFIEITEEGNYYLEASLDICSSERDSLNVDFKETLPKPVLNAKGPTVWYLSTPSDANYYKWYYNGTSIPGADNKIYVAGQNLGIYRVSISDDNTCFAFSDTIRIPTGAVGIEDIDPFEEVKIYPNPTTGMFTIEMNNNVIGELVIDIFTRNGSKVLNIKFEKITEHFSSQIDLSGQSKGMYLINLSLDKYRTVRKVVVE